MQFNLTHLSFLSCLIGTVSLFTACSADEPADKNQAKGYEMSFAVSGASRSNVISSFDQFAIYGDMKFTGSPSNVPIVIFDKTEVEKTDNGWEYAGVQYWNPNHEHSFVAISPVSVLEADNNPQYSNSTLTFTYTLPTLDDNSVDNSKASDIVAATHRRFYHENEVAGVTSLTFGHLLSLVNFMFELNGPTMKSTDCLNIHKIEFSGFGTSAKINIKPSSLQTASQTSDSDINIVTAKGNGRISINFASPIKVTTGGGAVKMFDNNQAIIMLPQTFEGNDKVQISLTYTVNDEAEETQVSANLSSFKWEWGRSYIYKIKLELEQKEVNMVISEATILPWNLIDDHDEVDAR